MHMMQSSDSGPVVLPRDDAIGRAAFLFDADTEPMDAPGATRRAAVTHPRNKAEVAQARLFEGILRGEIARLEQRADSMAYHWSVRRDKNDDRAPEDLVALRRRIGEARRLLETLQGRFLRPRRWGGRSSGPPRL